MPASAAVITMSIFCRKNWEMQFSWIHMGSFRRYYIKNNRKALWRLMREYFTVYLPKQRNSSPHTIAACRDTWNLFLRYLSAHKKLPIERIDFPDINRET